MKFLRKIAALIVRPFRALGRLATRRSSSPDPRGWQMAHMAELARSMFAAIWRKSIRWSVVLTGIAVFTAAQYGLANMINKAYWYQVFAVGCVISGVTFVFVNPILGFIGWIVLSPFLALFLPGGSDNVVPISFDQLSLSLLVFVLLIRAMADRQVPRRLTLAELLLVGSFIYSMFFSRTWLFSSFSNSLKLGLQIFDMPVFVYFIARAAIAKKEHASWVVVAIVVIGLSWALSGIYEQSAGHAWFSPFVGASVAIQGEHDIGVGRSTGPARHYYLYGLVLILAAFLSYHAAGWTRRVYAKFIYYIGSAAMLVGLYFGYSRAPYLVFGLFVLAMPFFARAGRARYTALLVTTCVALILIVPKLWSNIEFQQRMESDTGTARLALAATSLNIIRSNLWFGVGYGNYQEAAIAYVSGRLHPFYRSTTGTRILSRAHNEYLLVLAEQGVVGALLYFGTFIAFIVGLFRVRSRLPASGLLGKDLASIAIVFTITVLVAMMGDEFQLAMLHQYMYAIMFTMFALVMRMGELNANEAETPASAPSESLPAAAVIT